MGALALGEGYGGMAGAGTRISMLRRAAGLVVVLGFLIIAVVIYQLAPTLPRSSAAEPAPGSSSAPREDASASPTAAATPAAGSSSATPSSSASPSAPPSSPPSRPTTTKSSVPRTAPRLPNGPGTTVPGVLLIARPASDGSFEVSEMVRLSGPTSTLTLSPPDVTSAGLGFERVRPLASSVQLSTSEEVAVLPNGRVSKPIDVVFAAPATRFEARYRLSGVVVRSRPAPPGRALAAVGPIVGGIPADLPVKVMVTGSAVRNLVCPRLPLLEQGCAAGSAPRFRVDRTLAWRTALVLAQLDLPGPR